MPQDIREPCPRLESVVDLAPLRLCDSPVSERTLTKSNGFVKYIIVKKYQPAPVKPSLQQKAAPLCYLYQQLFPVTTVLPGLDEFFRNYILDKPS